MTYVMILAALSWLGPAPVAIDGITMAYKPGVLYAPARELGTSLGQAVSWEAESKRVIIGGHPVVQNPPRMLDGTALVSVRSLQSINARVTWDQETRTAMVEMDGHEVRIRYGGKRATVDKAEQMLRGWQGDRLVFESAVSTGRIGHRTPNGTWPAGPYKVEMHRSSLYDDAPMPWSVQITGNYFIHGYHEVPDRPSSHGCIRLPISGANPAKWFYNWIDVGAPVTIQGEWSD